MPTATLALLSQQIRPEHLLRAGHCAWRWGGSRAGALSFQWGVGCVAGSGEGRIWAQGCESAACPVPCPCIFDPRPRRVLVAP